MKQKFILAFLCLSFGYASFAQLQMPKKQTVPTPNNNDEKKQGSKKLTPSSSKVNEFFMADADCNIYFNSTFKGFIHKNEIWSVELKKNSEYHILVLSQYEKDSLKFTYETSNTSNSTNHIYLSGIIERRLQNEKEMNEQKALAAEEEKRKALRIQKKNEENERKKNRNPAKEYLVLKSLGKQINEITKLPPIRSVGQQYDNITEFLYYEYEIKNTSEWEITCSLLLSYSYGCPGKTYYEMSPSSKFSVGAGETVIRKLFVSHKMQRPNGDQCDEEIKIRNLAVDADFQ